MPWCASIIVGFHQSPGSPLLSEISFELLIFQLPFVDLLSLDIPRPGAGLQGGGEAPVGRTITAREGGTGLPEISIMSQYFESGCTPQVARESSYGNVKHP